MDSLYAFKCKRSRNTRHTVTIVKLFLKHPVIPVEVTLNRNYPRYNSMCFATL
jgi:hypothetical protein